MENRKNQRYATPSREGSRADLADTTLGQEPQAPYRSPATFPAVAPVRPPQHVGEQAVHTAEKDRPLDEQVESAGAGRPRWLRKSGGGLRGRVKMLIWLAVFALACAFAGIYGLRWVSGPGEPIENQRPAEKVPLGK